MKNEVIFGIHAIMSAIENDRQNIIRIFYDKARSDQRVRDLLTLAESLGIPLEQSTRKTLDKLSGYSRHQSVVAQYKSPKPKGEAHFLCDLDARPQPWLILVLDGIKDPHNLGACLRTADAAGVDAVLTPKDRAVGMTSVVCKVAAGAAGRVPFYQVTNLRRTLLGLRRRGVWIIGTADSAQTVYTAVDYSVSTAIVMGAEEAGLRKLTREQCDELVSVPMAGTVSSLNVSVATGICLFEAIRQRTDSMVRKQPDPGV